MSEAGLTVAICGSGFLMGFLLHRSGVFSREVASGRAKQLLLWIAVAGLLGISILTAAGLVQHHHVMLVPMAQLVGGLLIGAGAMLAFRGVFPAVRQKIGFLDGLAIMVAFLVGGKLALSFYLSKPVLYNAIHPSLFDDFGWGKSSLYALLGLSFVTMAVLVIVASLLWVVKLVRRSR